MKAKPVEQELLLEIQLLDMRVKNIEQKIIELDDNTDLSAAREELVLVRGEAVESQYQLDDKNLQIEKLSTDVVLVDERLERDYKLLDGNLSAKDAQSIEAEVENLKQRKSRLEDEQLDLMQELEEIQNSHQLILDKEQEIQARIDGYDQTIVQEKAKFEDEKHQTILDRRIMSAQIDPDLLNLYEDRMTRYGLGASKLEGRYSMGAGMELSSEDLAQISNAAADDVVFCPITQAILVRKGSTVG